VVAISDAETIKVMHDGVAERIRLHGIDAPERKQPFGSVARQYAGELAFGKTVTVHSLSRDRWGRTVAQVVLVW
jgi:endonuclease YncB( thermonuclease family)